MSTNISWTDETLNLLTGCTKVSDGCAHCYSEVTCNRMKWNPNPYVAHKFRNGFSVVTEHPQYLNDPILRRTPKKIFLNSLSDTFHKDVSDGLLDATFQMIRQHPQHTFQILTKRPEGFSRILRWPRNVWLGVTVESEKYLYRLDILKHQSISVKFVSLEPLLGPIPGDAIPGLDWVVLGGESGSKARPMNLDWAREIRDACEFYQVPLWFKQVGGRSRDKGGSLLDGEQYHNFPAWYKIKPELLEKLRVDFT